MNIYRKICVVFSNFVKKIIIIGGIKLHKKVKKFVKVQVSTIRLNQKRSDTIENKMITQNASGKSKMRFS